MTCKGFIQGILKLLNFVFTLVGLAVIGYGVYMLIMWQKKHSPPPSPSPSPSYFPDLVDDGLKIMHATDAPDVLQLRKLLNENAPILMGTPSFYKYLPKAWFIYLFIGVGVVIALITCSGYIAASTANGCCICCYTVFVALLVIAELALAGFIYFDHKWAQDIPKDATGQLNSIERFIRNNFKILKWVALVLLVLQAFIILFSIILRAMGSSPRTDYDSDEEYMAARSSARQPLLNRHAAPGVAASPAGASEARVPRTDAWSTRMREKYGLDTTDFSYNPTDSRRFATQNTASTEEKKSNCAIM